MDWYALGFMGNPFETDPITLETLDLFVGHEQQRKFSSKVIDNGNVNIIVEGARGVGTTSFANFLRFNAQIKKTYFTPRCEIRIERNWSLESLLGAVIINVVRELELVYEKKITKKEVFKKAKALANRMSEAYNSFGVSIFGVGINYGKSSSGTQPSMISSVALGHHIEDLATLVKELGYKNGLLIQFNNLDLGVVHEEKHLLSLFNAIRDYLQIRNTSWIFVGDRGLRSFIASQVDRLDDIITHEEVIKSLSKEDFLLLINKRLRSFAKSKKYIMPIKKDVLEYLYKITEGRLRYIFNLIIKLFQNIYFVGIADTIGLKIAKQYIKVFANDRIKNHQLTSGEEDVLMKVVQAEKISVSILSKKCQKSIPYVSKCLSKLLATKLVSHERKGTLKIYMPSLDAQLAYGE